MRPGEMAGTDSFGYAPAISPHRLPRLRSQRGSRGVLKLARECEVKLEVIPAAEIEIPIR